MLYDCGPKNHRSLNWFCWTYENDAFWAVPRPSSVPFLKLYGHCCLVMSMLHVRLEKMMMATLSTYIVLHRFDTASVHCLCSRVRVAKGRNSWMDATAVHENWWSTVLLAAECDAGRAECWTACEYYCWRLPLWPMNLCCHWAIMHAFVTAQVGQAYNFWAVSRTNCYFNTNSLRRNVFRQRRSEITNFDDDFHNSVNQESFRVP